MIVYDLFFVKPGKDWHICPHIVNADTVEFEIDDTQGKITFDGYYRVEDHAPPYPEDDLLEKWNRPTRYDEYLPQKLTLLVSKNENEYININNTHKRRKISSTTLETKLYDIIVYKRVMHECTNDISEIEDEDGYKMRVCFTPSDRQTIYFTKIDKSA
jgi:hypothetical protein